MAESVERERAPVAPLLVVWPTRDYVALGRHTGYCPGGRKNAEFETEPTPRPARDASLAHAYAVRTGNRKHAADKRIQCCGTRVFNDPHILTQEFRDLSRASHWTGVILCNRAGCPVCAQLRAQKFGRRVRRALQAGGWWQHVVLTISHGPADPWSLVYQRLIDALHALTKGRVGKIVMGLVQASIRATESTWSVRSGWHVHFHILWKLDRPLLEAEKQIVRGTWAGMTGASLERGAWFGGLFDCSVLEQATEAALYVSKLSHEISGTGKLAHPEHWTLGEIFERSASGDECFVELLREYQVATKGCRIYQMDKRARQICDAAPALPETVVLREWRTVVDRAEFSGLSRAERFGREPLAVYLPLEVANRARGDPALAIADTIDSLLRAFDADVRPKPPTV